MNHIRCYKSPEVRGDCFTLKSVVGLEPTCWSFLCVAADVIRMLGARAQISQACVHFLWTIRDDGNRNSSAHCSVICGQSVNYLLMVTVNGVGIQFKGLPTDGAYVPFCSLQFMQLCRLVMCLSSTGLCNGAFNSMYWTWNSFWV
jgi:hypothetical protein